MNRFRGALLLAAIVCLTPAGGELQAAKKKAQPPPKPEFSPQVLALFTLPHELVPTPEQEQKLSQLRDEYAPRAEHLFQQFQPFSTQDRDQKMLQQTGRVFGRGTKSPGLQRAQRVLQAQKQISAPQRIALEQQGRKLKDEIGKKVRAMLTDEQKRKVRDAESAARKSADKSKKK